MSVRFWNSGVMVLNCNIFAQESTCSKEIVLKNNPLMNYGSYLKKCQNRTFKVNFLRQKSTEYQFRRPFKKKTFFFVTSILEPLNFLKSCPIFEELVFAVFSKYNGFL